MALNLALTLTLNLALTLTLTLTNFISADEEVSVEDTNGRLLAYPITHSPEADRLETDDRWYNP